jgi:hypothetical protein
MNDEGKGGEFGDDRGKGKEEEEEEEEDDDREEEEESEHQERKRGWKHSRDGQQIVNDQRRRPLFPGYGFSRNNDGLEVETTQHAGAGAGDHNSSGYRCSEQKQKKKDDGKNETKRLLPFPHETNSCNSYNEYDDINMPFGLELGLDLELMQGADHVMRRTQHKKPIVQPTINHYYPPNTNDGGPGDRPREFPLHADAAAADPPAEPVAAPDSSNTCASSELKYLLSLSTASSSASTPMKIWKKERDEAEKAQTEANPNQNHLHPVIGRVRPKTPSPGKMPSNYNEPFEVILLNKARAPVPKIIVKTLLHKNRSSLKRQNYAAGSGASSSAVSPNSKLQHGKDSTKDMHAYYISWPENGDHEPPPQSRKLVIPDTQFKGRLIRFYTSYSEFKFIYNHIMKANRNARNSWVKHSKHNLEIYVPALADSTYNSLIHRIREVGNLT